ncbi:MAG: glycosyltransferase [Candidatus Diapherotrites archaeon]
MRVAVIGPIEPFRGGIAHSNTILCKKLAEKNQVLALSFKRLYPKILYPGRFQKEKGSPPKEFQSEFLIDSINPLSWKKTVKKIRKFKAEIVVFQWWTTFLAPCYWFIANKLKENCKISVICQNVLPHEKSAIHFFLAKSFLKKAESFVTLAKSDEELLKKIFPSAKVKTIIEPTYEVIIKKAKISKKNAMKRLGIKKPAILFFGFVRPYKGLEFLIKAMPKVLAKKDIELHIVGEFWEPKERFSKMIEELGIAKNVKIVDRYVSDEEAALYFAACDAVVLPYVSSTESGIIQLAFGHNTPIITTSVGGNIDLIENKKNGLLVEPQNPEALAKAILEFYEKGLEKKFKKAMLEDRKKFAWTKEKEKAVLGLF